MNKNDKIMDVPQFLYDKDNVYSGWLYKYMSNLDYIKEAIKDKTLHMSHPDTFNDPFDCGFVLTTESILKLSCMPNLIFKLISPFLDELERNKFVKLIKRDNSYKLIQNIVSILLKEVFNENPKMDFNALEMLIYMQFKVNNYLLGGKSVQFENNLKVACLSMTKSSFPMWAHYANNHKGICLEYDAKDVELSDINNVPKDTMIKVQYQKNYKTDDIENYYRVFYKSNQWEYENEVRIVCQMHGDKLRFPFLKTVILGVNTPQETKTELINFSLDNGVDVYCAEVSCSNEYSLDIVQRGDILKAYMDKGKKLLF